jgi:hypothetical protein
VKHCAYGYIVATMLNPRGVTTVSHKYNLTAARHATVIVAVTSTVHCPAKYKIIYYLRWNLKVEINFTLIIHYKLLEVASYDTQTCYNSPFCKPKHLHRG